MAIEFGSSVDTESYTIPTLRRITYCDFDSSTFDFKPLLIWHTLAPVAYYRLQSLIGFVAETVRNGTIPYVIYARFRR